MSAAQHEEMAKSEEKASEVHLTQYDPTAKGRQPCVPGASRVCWRTETNPTAQHADEWAKHQKAAADHRAASQALRDAESRACAGIADADRDESPFEHREDIIAVEPLTEPSTLPKGSSRVVGATVVFRAVPGMTAQWLQRLVDCHLARNAALGNEVAEMAYCPLVPKGASATVTATQTGFAVAIRGSDPQSIDEITRRSKALTTK
jgi:hypothetical protein